jgi:diadenosine tetraphosphatase ApaH/serine/threonine PP2A family protein phosphatase
MLAILYDIHANLPALEAVLADAESAGAERHLLGGDYAALGAWPNETLERLRELQGPGWLRGNWERWLDNAEGMPDISFIQRARAWAVEQLDEAIVTELAALPMTLSVDGILFSHASPISDMRSFMPQPADDERELLESADGARRLVFGHTHLQFQRETDDGVELVNPGSVGLPFDGDVRAAYALLHDDGRLELRRVEYDHERVAAVVRERISTFGEDLAQRLDTASPPPRPPSSA